MKTSLLSLFAAVTFAACACSSAPKQTTTTTTTDNTTTDTTDTTDQTASGPARGEKCGDDGACAEGLECVSYYGIAGPSGPQFTSCETPCKDDEKACLASGTSCVNIADGPGYVCR
jgi:hypothetical protein